MKLLFELEKACPMDVAVPASQASMELIINRFPTLPEAVLDLYKISNGLEINVPGTAIYSIDELLENNDTVDSDSDMVNIGHMSFGDELWVDINGNIVQVNFDTGEAYLTWPSFKEFLIEELSNVS